MNLLDRHIFKSVLFTCAAAIGIFTFVVALPNVIRDLLSALIAGQLTPEGFIRGVLLIIPFAVSYALPMGILTGVLLTLGRLSADSEITAMRASGISVFRLARPVFLLGILCTALALYINFESAPRARIQFYRELATAARTDPLSFIVPKTFNRDFRGCVIYIGEKIYLNEKDGYDLRDIWIWELDDERRVRRLVRAESGQLAYDEKTNSLVPTLRNAKTEERDPANPEDFSKSPRAPSVETAEEVRISLDRYFARSHARFKQDWLTYDELRKEMALLEALPPPEPDQSGQRAREKMSLALVFQDKFNISLAVLSFTLIGVPLGIKVSRRETSANLGLALLLVLCFYFSTVMVKWLDRQPELRPDLLLWLPNLFFMGLGIWLFVRLDRK